MSDRLNNVLASGRDSPAEGPQRLNMLFNTGLAPDAPLDGVYRGAMLALDLAPGLTQLATAIAARWMPWLGKRFDARRACGTNLFARSSLPLAALFNPTYRAFVNDGPNAYRAFRFRTSLGRGLMDPGQEVLKIDYDLPENPAATVRRVLDELVQLDQGVYLGKAHLRWWWGRWQTVAYFALYREASRADARSL
jgi:hypothetical protein